MAAYKNKEELMNTNWQQKINDAKAAGDMKAAAEYEQARNDKINSKEYTGKQTTTNNYSKYLDDDSSGGKSSGKNSQYSMGDTVELAKGPGYVTGGYTIGVNGDAILGDNPYWNGVGKTDLSRRPDLAGRTAISNGMTIFYDEDGYASTAKKGVTDYLPHKDWYVEQGTYKGGNLWTDEELMSADDLKRIADIRAGIASGKYTGDKANQLANQIRANYGYTIDKNGNVYDSGVGSAITARRNQWGMTAQPLTDAQQKYLELMFPEQYTTDSNILMNALMSLHNGTYNPDQLITSNVQYPDVNGIPGGFGGGYGYGGSYGDAPTWNGSEWDSVLNSLADKLLNMNYTDWTQGDQYKALADRYGQQGRMSMQDVLGQISSRTGGLASSWAQTSANQQYNSFMSQLEDAAMEMYGVEMNDLYDRANMARQYAQDDYNRYVDDYNRWANNRDFYYNAYRDSVSDQRYEDQLAYERQQDALAQNSSGTTKPNLTAAQTLTALKNGVVNDTTMSAYEYYFGEPYGGTTGTVDTGKKTGGGSYNNGSLTTAQVKQLQKKLGVTADGMWGAKSKKAAGGLSADDAWKKFGNTVNNTVNGSDYWLGNGTTVGGKTSFSYDEDEGIFVWNGKTYNSVTSMLNDIENANLTDSEMSTLKKKLSMYGFNLA